jgi:hypothetical protein
MAQIEKQRCGTRRSPRAGVIPGLLISLLAAVNSQAAFVTQPYLQDLTDSSIVVRWETGDQQAGMVQFGPTARHGREVSQPSGSIDHELTLTGLQRNRDYHYHAISGPDTGADAVFHTPVISAKPFRFVVYGDGDDRIDDVPHRNLIDRMTELGPSPGLMLATGDLTEGRSLPGYQAFFNGEFPMTSRVALFPAVGNHEFQDMALRSRFFALPGNECWYTVRYGDCAFHFVSLYSSYTPGSEQYEWLLSELKFDSADHDVRYIFVTFHEPPYTTNTTHPSNLDVRRHLCPLFERFHVAIAFQGHDHCYEHSLVNGVHYIITGGGGAPLYDTWGPVESWTVYREATYEFVLVDVRVNEVRCQGIRSDGTAFDSFTIERGRKGEQEGKQEGKEK